MPFIFKHHDVEVTLHWSVDGSVASIKPVLMNLHWLPVEQRIQYKLLIQVYKALNGLEPEYIADLLQEYVPTRSLRSAGAHLLIEPKTTTRWGARAFSKAAPVLWNTAINHKSCSFISLF